MSDWRDQVIDLLFVAAAAMIPDEEPARPEPLPVVAPLPRYMRVSVWDPGEGLAVQITGALQFEDPTWPPVEAVIEEKRLRFLLPEAPIPAQYGWFAQLTVRATENRLWAERIEVKPDVDINLPPRRPPARRGKVGLERRCFVDRDGPFLGAGASLFWGPWAYLNDKAKLERNLAVLSGRLDFIRVFAVVGPSGGWGDRTMTMANAREAFDGFNALVYDQHGMRVEWTIFAGVDNTDAAGRAALVEDLAARAIARPEPILFFQVANEGWKNGFPGEEGKAEMWRLAAILNRAGLPVALTDPEGGDVGALYQGSPATLVTAHLERDVQGTGGMFRPVRQARELVGHTWVSDEPIGPQSSVASDGEPVRLVLAAIHTWLCNGAAYVLHTGAGIRGGGAADIAGGRSANMWEVPRIEEILDGLAAARQALPPDLPNWQWMNGNANFPRYPFDTDPLIVEDQLLRAFIAVHDDGRFVCVPLKVEKTTPFTARRPMTLEVVDPMSGKAAESTTLQAGQTYHLTPRAGAIFRGRFL